MASNYSSQWRAYTMMHKTLFTTVSVLALLLPPLSFAQDKPQHAQPARSATSTVQEAQADMKAVRASNLTGMTVQNQQGETLGEIEHVMIATQDGHIAYVVLDFGGWFDFGGKHAAAPWSALTVNPDAENVTLNIDKEKLRQAPGFERTYAPDTVERAWLGLGQNLAAVPWEALELNIAERQFTLNIDQDKLEKALRFARDEWPQTLDRKWLSDMYAYYGEKPYWEMR